jgi:hypothetical protein
MAANGDAEAGRRQRTFAALSNARGNLSMPMIDLDAARERAAALKERLAETSAKLAERSEKTAAAFQEKVSAASQRAAPTIDALKERALKERDALKERAASLPSSSRMMSMMSANVSSEKLESKLGSFKAWGHSAVDRMAKMTAEQHGHAPTQSADNDATAAGIYRQRRVDVDSDEEEMEAKVPTADLLGGELLDGASASGSNFGPALSGGGMGATSSVDLLCDWLGGSSVSSAPGDLMSDFIAPPPLQPIAAMPPPTAPFGGLMDLEVLLSPTAGASSPSCSPPDAGGGEPPQTRERLERWISGGRSEPSLLSDLTPQELGWVWAVGWDFRAGEGQGEATTAEAYVRMCVAAEAERERMAYDWNDGFRKGHGQLCADFDVIDRDVPRTTLPSGGRFRSWTPAELTQVLEAHLVAESQLPAGQGMGYVQGMADVAAFLLQRLPPVTAYGALRRLCARPLVRTFFRLDTDEWLTLSSVFSTLIGTYCPTVFAKLEQEGLEPALYLPEWLMPLWSRSLSVEAASHVFSLTLLEGDAIFVRAAIAALVAIEPLVLKCRDLPECSQVLSKAPRQVSFADFMRALEACPLDPSAIAPLVRIGGQLVD